MQKYKDFANISQIIANFTLLICLINFFKRHFSATVSHKNTVIHIKKEDRLNSVPFMRNTTFCKPCSVSHLSLIYALLCSKTLSSYPSAAPSRHFTMTINHCMPIYLDFQLIRFARTLPSLTIAAGSYPAFSPLPQNTYGIFDGGYFLLHFLSRIPNNIPACPLDSMMLCVARTFLLHIRVQATDNIRCILVYIKILFKDRKTLSQITEILS